MKKFFLLLVIVLVVWLGSIIVANTKSEVKNYPPKGTKILAFGDSLVEGVGATPGNDFVSRLENELDIEILNYGKRGDTTASALNRVQSAINQKPDIVIILLGGNDALRRIPQEETIANLRKIVNRFQEAGAVTMILGVRGGLSLDPYGSMYWQLADETGSILVTDVLRGLFGNRSYMSDAVHPNDAGYEVIARRVSFKLADVLTDINKKLK